MVAQTENKIPKLDYSLTDIHERNQLVKKIIELTPPHNLTPRYLDILAKYIIFEKDKEKKKQQRKERTLITENKLATINKREMSFQGLAMQLENGEDGIYNMIANDKNIIFMPKVEITRADLAEIPELKEIQKAIESIEATFATATGKRKYLLKKQIIELRKEQYIIKNHYHPLCYLTNAVKTFTYIDFTDHIEIDAESHTLTNKGLVSFFEPKHISALLCNYSRLKEAAYGQFNSDGYYLMEDFDGLCERALAPFPMYDDIVLFKIDGKTNDEIRVLLKKEFHKTYTPEYISKLWRQIIPSIIAETAKKEYLEWYYTYKEYGNWKKCSRCGQVKLAHPLFFSKNNSSKDGFYSICKDCRNKKPEKQVRQVDLR